MSAIPSKMVLLNRFLQMDQNIFILTCIQVVSFQSLWIVSIIKAGCDSGSRKRKATSGKQPVGQKKHCCEDLNEQNITNLDSHFLGMSHLNCVLNTLMHAKCCSQRQG